MMQEIAENYDRSRDKFTIIYEHYGQALKRKAYSMLKDIKLAEDAVQWTFVKALGHMDNIGEPYSQVTRSYLYTILINTCKNMIKSNKKYFLVDDDTMQLDYVTRIGGKDSLIDHLLYEELLNDVRKLPQIYSNIMILYAFKNYTLAEISEMLNLKPATVRKRIQRSREMLIKARIKEKYC